MLWVILTCERDLRSMEEERTTPDGEKISEGVAMLATLISLVVRVPVLSEQMKSTQPSASTVGSRFTTAFLGDNLKRFLKIATKIATKFAQIWP